MWRAETWEAEFLAAGMTTKKLKTPRKGTGRDESSFGMKHFFQCFLPRRQKLRSFLSRTYSRESFPLLNPTAVQNMALHAMPTAGNVLL